MQDSLSFGQWLKRRRLGLGMTQDELGRRTGYSGVSIRKVEADERRPSHAMAEQLANALAVPLEDRPAFMQFARDEVSALPVPTVGVGIPTLGDSPAPTPPPNNLPLQLTSFVGREREMARLDALLDANRLVTLTGVGGTGKTRLALAVAARRVDRYPHGTWLVELAPLMDAALLPQALARVLNVSDEPGRPLLDTLTAYLSPKHLLLLLDNCEHLIEACAQLAEELLRICPQLQILATSRETLGVVGETNFHVPSLAVPDPKHTPMPDTLHHYEAPQLFIQRATTAMPDFEVTPQNTSAIVQICAQLDGIPLAIELAAARVRVLKVEQIAARLDDRFRLLTGGSRTALPRQQTLQALIDWSYSLLTEDERKLLHRLSVFSGGWTLEAAEAVCSGEGIEGYEVLDLLTRLVDKSLVLVDTSGEETRHRLLETIRQYGRDKLLESGEGNYVRDQHVAYFLKLAEEGEIHLWGPQQIVWMQRLATEYDNLRAALRWSVASEQGLRLVGALAYFWYRHTDWSEGTGWAEEALAHTIAQGRTASRAKALFTAGVLNRDDRSRSWYEESIAISRELGDQHMQAYVLIFLGSMEVNANNYATGARLYAASQSLFHAAGIEGVTKDTVHLWMLKGDLAMQLGDYASARTLYEQGIIGVQKMGDQVLEAVFNSHLAWLEEMEGDYTAARRLYNKRLNISRTMNMRSGILEALLSLVRVVIKQGDYPTATTYLGEGLAMARELDIQFYIFNFTAKSGEVAWLAGDHRRAAALYTKSLGMLGNIEPDASIANLFRAIARLALAHGAAARAVQLGGMADATKASFSNNLLSFPVNYERDLAAARTQLGDVAYEAAWAAGQAMTLDQAVAYALETLSLTD